MQDSQAAQKYWHVREFCRISSQFCEAYIAYRDRSSQVMKQRTVADEVELFNICHALELALKGWLLLRVPGMTVRKLASPAYGHNLVKLAKEVSPHYPDIEPYLALIGDLARRVETGEPFTHRKYGYPDIEDKGIPVPMPFEPFADFVTQCRFDLYLTCEREQLPA